MTLSRRRTRQTVPDDETATELIQAVRPPDWDGSTYMAAPALPIGARPPALHAPPRPQPPPPPPRNPRLQDALLFICFNVAIMESRGTAYRIAEADHARRRGDEIPPQSDVGRIRREATTLLLGAGTR